MWAVILNILLGLWLMATPAVLGITQPAANVNHILGPLIVTFAVVALWEVNSKANRVNVVFGVLAIVALFVFDFHNTAAIASNIISGIAVILLSFVKRKISQRYGGGWRSLLQKDPLHVRESGD